MPDSPFQIHSRNIVRRFYAKRPSYDTRSRFIQLAGKSIANLLIYWLYHPELTDYTVTHANTFTQLKKTRVPSYAICAITHHVLRCPVTFNKTWDEPSDELFKTSPVIVRPTLLRILIFERPWSTTSITEHHEYRMCNLLEYDTAENCTVFSAPTWHQLSDTSRIRNLYYFLL